MMLEVLKRLFGLSKKAHPIADAPTNPAVNPVVTPQQPVNMCVPLNPPLLQAIANFNKSELLEGQLLFHGCGSNARDIDVSERRLGGTRKWFSSDAEYASFYGGTYSLAPQGLLWICRTRRTIPALVGSQKSLASVAPWKPHEFPSKLPDTFEQYAHHVLSTNGATALLDHLTNDGYKEILITSPVNVIEVLEVVSLPKDPEEARLLAKSSYIKYAVDGGIAPTTV